MKKFYIVAAFFFAVNFFSACGNNSETNNNSAVTSESEIFAEITDDAGNKITLNKKPERIVVASASFLESLHELGANIVGRPDSKNNTPDWAENIPSIGKVYQVDVERVLSCTPDLVIINKGMNEKLINILQENKIPVLVMEMKTYDEVKNSVKVFAKLSGNENKGAEIIQKMDADIKQTLEKIPAEKKRVAILHSTAQGLSVQLEGSIAGSIVKMLGWENIADGMTPFEKNPDAAPYSMETLAAQNPEIIFVTSMGNSEELKKGMQEEINSNAAWQTINAVKNNKIYYLPQNLFLLSPALNYPQAVKYLADLIYHEK
ncbi:MAG: ABC transporter substrate-binding protein [Selenomonadaceae bacterium]|nr:ABC transporter substrate-binding protein [Selenomonadaceae bacterium]